MLQRIDNDGELGPVLIDFGLSNVMPSDGRKLSISCGSMGYAAPELFAKRGHDTQIDVYAVGAIVYKMLSGCLLFSGRHK